jgi:hypothetical protein
VRFGSEQGAPRVGSDPSSEAPKGGESHRPDASKDWSVRATTVVDDEMYDSGARQRRDGDGDGDGDGEDRITSTSSLHCRRRLAHT